MNWRLSGAGLAALLLLAPVSSATSATSALQVSVVVQRSCTVTRLPAAATIEVTCSRGGAPVPVLVADNRPAVVTQSIDSSAKYPRVEILF